MSTPDVLVDRARDQDRFLRTDETVWFGELGSLPTQQQLLGVPERLRFAAEVEGADPSTYAGIYGVRPMTLSVPGRTTEVLQVPCAGLTWVGVHPDHRRQGILSAMMRHHLEQVRGEPGTHLSALHASEPAIYGRYGYGLASLELTLNLGRGTTLVAPHLDEAAATIRTEMATVGDDALPSRCRAVHLRGGATTLGAIVGDEDFFEKLCQEPPEQMRDKEPLRLLFARREGVDVGLAALRRTQKWEHGRSAGEMVVYTLVGDPAARLALLRRLIDFDLVSSVKIFGVGAEDPMLMWLGGPRGASQVETYDSLWVRLVDLPEALATRAYAAPCDVVVDVTDRAAPWNSGCWRVRVDDTGAGEVEKVTAEPDLALPAEALGSAYLGGTSLLSLWRAGMIEEKRAGAVLELSRAMRADLAPGAAIGF